MIGTEYNVIEFEFFVMVYVLIVMHQLMKDDLLIVPSIPGIIHATSFDTLVELHAKYPLPTYELMANYGYKILESHNKKLSFTQADLCKLFSTIEANNGYII